MNYRNIIMNPLFTGNILFNKEHWLHTVKKLDFAFQPIVNTETGIVYGVEALLRGLDDTNFTSIDDFFSTAYEDDMLYTVDIALRKKAVNKFKTIPFYDRIKLFYNYDPRIQKMDNYEFGKTEEILQNHHLTTDTICFELSEKFPFNFNELKSILRHFKERGINIVIDDFGAGFSGLELFYYSEPDIIKFDRFLVSNIDSDRKKRSFCFNLLNLSFMEGAKSIAEGVETEEEFATCRDLGFDYVQGFHIQRPTTDINEIKPVSKKVANAL